MVFIYRILTFIIAAFLIILSYYFCKYPLRGNLASRLAVGSAIVALWGLVYILFSKC